MAITAKQVQELRKATGAGMMDCKKALQEANGDMDGAIDILRKKGQKMAAKRADREVTEGAAFVWEADDNKEVIAFALNCETEPVSATDEFKTLGQSILDLAVANKPADKDALLALEMNGQSVQENIVELIGKIGEKIEVTHYVDVKGEAVAAYKHGQHIAVVVELSNGGDAALEAGRNVGMQIAAMKPLALDENGVDASLIEKEKEIGLDKARQEGKPEHILDRIAEGYVKKFLKDNTLLNQEYVKDSSMTVAAYLKSVEKDLTVKSYERVSTGR